MSWSSVPPHDVSVRSAEPNDVEPIAAIERVSFSDPWTKRSFVELFDRPDVVFLAAVCAGDVVGYAVCYYAADEGELANVAVSAAHRRQGVGAQLVEAVRQRVSLLGVRHVWLEVRASNVGAAAMYRAVGFRDVGLRKRYYDKPVEDAIVMMGEVGR